MKKFISKLKGQIYDDPLSSVLVLTLCIVLFLFGFVASIVLMVKTFILLLYNVPSINII